MLAKLSEADREQFELIEEWSKIRHTPSGHELLPGQVSADFLKAYNNDAATRIPKTMKQRVQEPKELSTFLTEHKERDGYLYCHLTRS